MKQKLLTIMRQKLLTMICAALLCMGAGQVWAAVTVKGKLPGAFSVNTKKVVYFSQGNLRASTMNYGSSWTWSFATNQYDYIGNATANNAIYDDGRVHTNGYVDLFGWSTGETFFGINDSKSEDTYSGWFKDWGENAIANGGNTRNAWRTLERGEWNYLFFTRSTKSGIRYAKATVNSIAGVILLPDNWDTRYYALSNTNTATAAFTSNTISSTDWTNLLEPRGAVFLPAAGMRSGSYCADGDSYYWTASFELSPATGVATPGYLIFNNSNLELKFNGSSWRGSAVRLVSETAPPYATLTKSPTAKSLTYTGSAQALVNAGTASDGTMNYSLDNSSWSTSIPTATNIGNYTVYYKVVGDASHADYLPSYNIVTVTINKVTPTVTAPTAKSLTYNGSAQALVNAGSTTGGTLQYELDNGWGTSVPTATAAGSYKVYYRVVGNANYNDVAEKSVWVTINKATLTCKADNKSINYNSNPPTYTATYSGWKGSDNTSVLSGTLSFACSYAKGNNPGSYTITPSGVTASNYNYNITFQTGTLTVNKINPTVTAPTAKSLTYNGSAQALVNAGSTTGGTLQYKLGNGSWVTSVPTAAAAGSYTVYYRVVGNTYYNDVAQKSVSVTINKATLTCKADNKSINYNSNPPTYTATYSGWKGSDNTSVLSGTLSFACSYAKGSNAGSYTITPSGGTASNYNITFQTGTLTVNKINPTVTAPTAKSLTYNGSAQALVNAGSTTGGTLQYSLTSGSGYGNAIPTQTAAGTYRVYYKVDGNDNYNAVAEASVSVTISKAALTCTADNKSANYGDNPPSYTATYSGWKGSDNTSVLSGTLSFACSYAKGSNAGSYTITPSGVTASNYAITFNNGTLTVNKADPVVTAPTAKSLTYNGSAQALVNAGSTTGGTLQYSLTSGSGYGNAIPTQTAADTYTVYYKVDGNDNYNAVAEASVSVTINKADVILTAPTPIEGLVYTGAAQTLINAGTVTGGELLYKLDAGAYSTSLPQATEADIYTVYYKVDGDANHNNVAGTSFTVTIGDPTSLVLTANRDLQHPDDYYSTFYHSAIQYALPEGSEAYAATLSGDALNLTRIAEAGDVLPADNAVILKASGSSIILTPSDESPVTFEVINNLRGVDVPTAAPSNCYVLSGHNSDYSVQGVGFYLFTGTIPAHKAYATIDGNAGAPTRLRFVFNNEQTATGIQNASAVLSKPTKVIENGTLYIIRDGIRYNAQGQIVK